MKGCPLNFTETEDIGIQIFVVIVSVVMWTGAVITLMIDDEFEKRVACKVSWYLFYWSRCHVFRSSSSSGFNR